MYQYWLVSLAIASAPFVAPLQQSAAPAKPAPSTQKPAAAKPAPADAKADQGAAAKGVRTIEIVGTDDMKFSLATIAAKRGEQLRVRLTVKGAMPKVAMSHNFVLLDKAVKPVEFVTAAMNARATDFIPADKKAQVIAHTGLAGAGETVEVTFKVPNVAGDYPYLCSFPGHFQVGMKGTMSVK